MKAGLRFASMAALSCLVVGLSQPAAGQARKPGAAAARPASAATTTTPAAPAAAAYAERFRAVCAACHGLNGRSEMAGTPVLAGQYPLYAITQLFLFREGRRDNEAMVALGKQMSDADLRGFSDYIGTLPSIPPPAPDTPPDAATMNRGKTLAVQHKCTFCHGSDFAGGQQVPRIGGQKQDYLLTTLQGFKSGTRPGYTRAMTEALSQVPTEDLEPLAYYIARFKGD